MLRVPTKHFPTSGQRRVVAYVNVTRDLMRAQQRKGRRAGRFFFLQVDSCANLSLVTSAEMLTDVRPALGGQVVMMNSHPETITAYGTLTCELRDEKTGAWAPLVINDVAVVPGSSFNLLGWSSYERQIATSVAGPFSLVFSGNEVHLPLVPSGSAIGSQRGGLFSFRCRLVHARAHALIDVATETRAAHAEEEERESEAKRELQLDLISEGAMILAKAKALMAKTHHRFGCVVKIGAIQNMIRKGDLKVTNAQVKKAMLQMEASELECVACDLASTNKRHPNKKNTAVMAGQWTIDESGKYARSRNGNRYVVVVVAPNGKGLFTEFINKKSLVPHTLRTHRRTWQRKTGEKMVRIRMDRAGEHTGRKMTRFLQKYGIIPSFTAPDSSAGPAEGYIHILQDAMSAQLNHYATLHKCPRPESLWEHAFAYAGRVKEMTWCTTNDGISMYEKRTGQPPPLDKCHVFGANVFANVPVAQRKAVGNTAELMGIRKGANRGRHGRFLGFAKDGAGFLVLDPKTNTVFRSDSVRIHDNAAGSATDPESAEVLDAVDKEVEFVATGMGQPAATTEEKEEKEPADAIVQVEAAQAQGEEPDLSGQDLEVVMNEPRTRSPPQRLEYGHDEWQTLVTDGKPFAIKRAIEEDMAAEKRKEELLRLRVKARTTGSFLRARSGVLPSGVVPQSDTEALNGDDREIWIAAIGEEADGLEEKKVMEKVKYADMEKALRKGERLHVIGSKFVYDIKLRSPSCTLTGPCYRTLEDGTKVRYKARLVAKGFTQRPGVEYDIDEKYAPTPQIASIRLILPHVFSKKWQMRQLDVKQAFLISELPESEQILMRPPAGGDVFNGKYLWRLLRSLYGLMQAAHHWHREIKGTLLKHGFECIDADQGVYVRYDMKGELLCTLALHVDDCLVSAPDGTLEEVTSNLKSTYKMSDQAADWFLKIRINNQEGRTLSLSQPAYAAEIVKAAGMENANSVTTPMEAFLEKGTELPFTEEEGEFMATKYETYGKVTGMLSYLANGTRPDISYSVGQVQLYTQFPRKHHWRALMRIVRYIKGTLNHGLMFRADGENKIVGCCDSDWAGNTDDRTSTSGYVFTYLGTAFSWKSKKQSGKQQGRLRNGEERNDKRVTSDRARSSCEAELRALDLATREALWLRKLGKSLRVPASETIPIYEDNEAAYYIAKGSKWSSDTKHIATMYYAVRDDIIDERIDLCPIASKDNMSDMFTKPLKRVLFEKFRLAMGVCDVTS